MLQISFNLILCKKTTFRLGFADRMQKEIVALSSLKNNLNIIAPLDRLYSAWVGGSILATLPSFRKNWISKAEYIESGSEIIHKMCT